MPDIGQVFVSLPQARRTSEISSCEYHLGVIAMKRGDLDTAVGHLRRSRQLDEAVMDLQGMHVCDRALATCEAAGADMSTPAFSWAAPWVDPNVASEQETLEISLAEPQECAKATTSGPSRAAYSHRELLWVVSSSVQSPRNRRPITMALPLLRSRMTTQPNDCGQPP